MSLSSAKKVAWILLLVGILGVGATYWDFSHTMHKVMKAKFHFGFYLFWLGWAVSCLYFISVKRPREKSNERRDREMKEVKNEE